MLFISSRPQCVNVENVSMPGSHHAMENVRFLSTLTSIRDALWHSWDFRLSDKRSQHTNHSIMKMTCINMGRVVRRPIPRLLFQYTLILPKSQQLIRGSGKGSQISLLRFLGKECTEWQWYWYTIINYHILCYQLRNNLSVPMPMKYMISWCGSTFRITGSCEGILLVRASNAQLIYFFFGVDLTKELNKQSSFQ